MTRARLALLLALLLVASAVVAARPALATTTLTVTVKADVAAAQVSWNSLAPLAGGSFVVRNDAGAVQCTTTLSHCTIGVTATQPTIRYQVSQVSKTGVLVVRSGWSAPLATTHLIVVAGQSNAMGAGAKTTIPSLGFNLFNGATSSPADQRVDFSWMGCGVAGSGSAGPKKLSAPQYLGARANGAVFGIEVGIARTLWAAGWHNLSVNKVTCGGTDIAHYWLSGASLFSNIVTSTLSLEDWYVRHNVVPVVVGGFWMQGEADAADATYAGLYQSHLESLVRSIRGVTPRVANLPLVAGVTDISEWIRATAYTGAACRTTACQVLQASNAEVRAADLAVASEFPLIYTVDSKSYPRDAVDHLHLTSTGELALGTAMATTFLQHVTK